MISLIRQLFINIEKYKNIADILIFLFCISKNGKTNKNVYILRKIKGYCIGLKKIIRYKSFDEEFKNNIIIGNDNIKLIYNNIILIFSITLIDLTEVSTCCTNLLIL
jgi:hypothetical protein